MTSDLNPRATWLEFLPGGTAVVGHRGACGYAPENTLASFRLAVDLGADYVELDVQMTRDGHPVVIHDWTVDRTTNGHGAVRDLTLVEVKALDAGARHGPAFAGERVPTLAEVLAWARGQTKLAIELKHAPVHYSGLVEAVLAQIREQDLVDDCFLISFDHPEVRRVKALEPRLATGVLFAGRPVDPISLARAAGADALAPQWSFVNRELVEQAHAAGLAILAWTTNAPAEMEYLLACGVDAIGTDCPDRLREIRDSRGQERPTNR